MSIKAFHKTAGKAFSCSSIGLEYLMPLVLVSDRLKLLQFGLESLFSFFFSLVTLLMIIRNLTDFACKLLSKCLRSFGMPDNHNFK